MLNKPTYGSQPIKNEQDRTVKPYLFDDIAQNNKQDQEKYVSLVDLQEFIFNTCNVDDNTIFIDFHNYLQFLDRQRSLAQHPLSDEDIERAANKYDNKLEGALAIYTAFIDGANFAKQPISNEVDETIYCNCETPTLGKSITRCGTCDNWFKPLPHPPKK